MKFLQTHIWLFANTSRQTLWVSPVVNPYHLCSITKQRRRYETFGDVIAKLHEHALLVGLKDAERYLIMPGQSK